MTAIEEGRLARVRSAIRHMLPGFLAALAVAAVARIISRLLPGTIGEVLHEVVIAVALGIVVAAVGLPATTKPGLQLAASRILRIGIVLLGVRIAFADILQLGGPALGVIVILMVVAMGVALATARSVSVGHRTGTLVGVGVAVCGNSAIAAAAPTIGARDDEISQAVAVNTLFGTLALFAYPLIGSAFTLAPETYGLWSGTAINDTAQVVAAGFAHSDTAGEVAVTVKLVRNALMAPVLVLLAVVYTRLGSTERLTARQIRKAVPGFVVAFVLLALATNLGIFDTASDALDVQLNEVALSASRSFILVGLAGVGLSTTPAALRRGGGRVLVIGFAAAAAVSVASLAIINWLDLLGG